VAGLVPAISIQLARHCHGYRDRRVKPMLSQPQAVLNVIREAASAVQKG
jgi:hypothetical protein